MAAKSDTTSKPRARHNGEGSVYQQGDRWRGAMSWMENGVRHRKLVSGATAKEVRTKLDALKALKAEGKKPGASTTLATFAAEWLKANAGPTLKPIKPATWRMRSQVMNAYVLPFLGSKRLDQLTPQGNVDRMTQGILDKGLSPRTAHHARTVLRTALRAASAQGLLHGDPVADSTSVVQDHHELVYLDPDQVRILVENTVGADPIYTVLVQTGMRLGEALGLAWKDVHLDLGNLDVTQTLARNLKGGYSITRGAKTKGSVRTIELSDRAIEALSNAQALQEAQRAAMGDHWQDKDGLVFTDPLGRPMRLEAVHHRLQRILDGLGLKRASVHSLRHSYATMLLAANVPPMVVANQLGHATPHLTLALYGHVLPKSRSAAADVMNCLIGCGMKPNEPGKKGEELTCRGFLPDRPQDANQEDDYLAQAIRLVRVDSPNMDAEPQAGGFPAEDWLRHVPRGKPRRKPSK